MELVNHCEISILVGYLCHTYIFVHSQAAWTKIKPSALLFVGGKQWTNNPRISVKENKGAYSQLRINNAELIDQGWYKCEFGNVNKTSTKVFLEVLKSEKTTTTPSTPSQATIINQTTSLNIMSEKSR